MGYYRIRTVFVFTLVLFLLFACSGRQDRADSTEAQGKRGEYAFSIDWFSEYIPIWEELFASLKGKPNFNYLEIGVFEGKSFFWVLDNILTHESSRATGIDIFPGDVEGRFMANLQASGNEARVTVIKGSSQVELRNLPMGSYDLIYVDGSHAAKDVLADAVLCWPLLKNGGLMILDDYQWSLEWPLEFRPQIAIDSFLTVFRNDLEVVHGGFQLVIRKREFQVPYLLRLGDYAYSWRRQELYRIGEQQPTVLSDEEHLAIAALATARGFGQCEYVMPEELAQSASFAELLKRLEIELE
jgi:predicted O-methyltransferase YrrM